MPQPVSPSSCQDHQMRPRFIIHMSAESAVERNQPPPALHRLSQQHQISPLIMPDYNGSAPREQGRYRPIQRPEFMLWMSCRLQERCKSRYFVNGAASDRGIRQQPNRPELSNGVRCPALMTLRSEPRLSEPRLSRDPFRMRSDAACPREMPRFSACERRVSIASSSIARVARMIDDAVRDEMMSTPAH
jgi:hypothetical protein